MLLAYKFVYMPVENILITDYHCASNRGDAAILEGEIAVFDEMFPGADVTVMTEYPKAAELVHGVDAVSQQLPPFNPSNILKNGATAFSLVDGMVRRGSGKKLPFSDLVTDKLGLQPYHDADVIVSTGGQYMTAAYYPDKIAILAEWYLAEILNKPLIIYAQSLGPFESPYRGITRFVMDRADLIITRDEQSKEHLDQIGVSTETHVGVDAAWMMPLEIGTNPLGRNLSYTPSLPERSDGPLISISARHWSHFDTENGEEKYLQAVADTASELIRTRNAEIVFLSTCTGLAGYHTDDRVAASDILDRMEADCREHAQVITEELTPQHLVELYGEMDLHIGTRMHSCILALLAETPVVAIEYQFKTSGMMSQFGLADRVVNIDGIDTDELQTAVADGLKDREEIQNQIRSHLPEIKEKALEDGRKVRDHLDGL